MRKLVCGGAMIPVHGFDKDLFITSYSIQGEEFFLVEDSNGNRWTDSNEFLFLGGKIREFKSVDVAYFELENNYEDIKSKNKGL